MSRHAIILPRGEAIGDLLTWDGSGWVAARSHIHRVTWVAYPAAQGTWTNMAAAKQFYLNTDRTITKTDLTGYTQCRLLVMKSSVAGAASAIMYLEYKTGTFSSNPANYTIIGTSVQVSLNVANTHLETDWIDIAAAARVDDVWLAITGDGGDGVIDPQFGVIAAEFRRGG